MSDNPVKWTAAGLTPAGNALQAALLGTGDGLTFTRAAAADAEGVERLDLTLQSPCTVDGPKCRVPVLLTNLGVDTAFTMTELRFYVRRVTDGAPTGEEVLYATVTDETGDPIPTAAQSPGFTIDWAFVFQFGNAGNVTVTLDPVGLVSIGMVGQPGGVAGLDDNGTVPIEQGGTGATTADAAADALCVLSANPLHRVQIPDGANIKEFLPGKPFGYYYVDVTDLVEGMPTTARTWWFVTYSSNGVWAWTFATDTIWHAELSNGVLRGWRKVSFGDPPDELGLPLVSGYTGTATYMKTQESIVFARIRAVHKTDGSNLTNDGQIATLPEDCRPKSEISAIAAVSDGTYTRNVAGIIISADGIVKIAGLSPEAASTAKYVGANFFFLAN